MDKKKAPKPKKVSQTKFVVPQAPGNDDEDRSWEEDERGEETLKSFAKSLQDLIENLPFSHNLVLCASYDEDYNEGHEGNECVKFQFWHDDIEDANIWRICFHANGEVSCSDYRATLWKRKTWASGFEKMIRFLLKDAETEQLNAAKRIKTLRDLLVSSTAARLGFCKKDRTHEKVRTA